MSSREYFRGFGGGGGGAAVVASTLRAGATGGLSDPVFCVGPLQYIGQQQVQTDIENLRAALQGVHVEEAVLTAIAPGTIEHWLHNEYYKSDEDFLFAIADAMNEEYRAIADAGFLLQIDDPDLADAWQIHPDMDVAAYRAFADLRVESINVALSGVPRESVRLHVCWGSIHGPHKHDIPLEDIVDLILKVNAGVYSVEASNPRHEHEWRVWDDFKLPEGSVLMPGVVGHASDFVEHPDLVAERLVRYAAVVGRENVIAGTDCGLGGRVGHEKLVWAKFESMVQKAPVEPQKSCGAVRENKACVPLQRAMGCPHLNVRGAMRATNPGVLYGSCMLCSDAFACTRPCNRRPPLRTRLAGLPGRNPGPGRS